MKIITATKLRQNLYNILDNVIESGLPVEIERHGHKLKIIPEEKKSKLEKLEEHDIIKGTPEELVDIEWSDAWQGEASV
jgi:PHD/YefM family antitoxin component YafN of YafNO toxin-antitoxin module